MPELVGRHWKCYDRQVDYNLYPQRPFYRECLLRSIAADIDQSVHMPVKLDKRALLSYTSCFISVLYVFH